MNTNFFATWDIFCMLLLFSRIFDQAFLVHSHVGVFINTHDFFYINIQTLSTLFKDNFESKQAPLTGNSGYDAKARYIVLFEAWAKDGSYIERSIKVWRVAPHFYSLLYIRSILRQCSMKNHVSSRGVISNFFHFISTEPMTRHHYAGTWFFCRQTAILWNSDNYCLHYIKKLHRGFRFFSDSKELFKFQFHIGTVRRGT